MSNPSSNKNQKWIQKINASPSQHPPATWYTLGTYKRVDTLTISLIAGITLFFLLLSIVLKTILIPGILPSFLLFRKIFQGRFVALRGQNLVIYSRTFWTSSPNKEINSIPATLAPVNHLGFPVAFIQSGVEKIVISQQGANHLQHILQQTLFNPQAAQREPRHQQPPYSNQQGPPQYR